MNELILELAKQAGLKKEHASDREYIGNFDWRLFAELIVRECSAKAWWAEQYGIGDGVPIYKQIEQHFGVK